MCLTVNPPPLSTDDAVLLGKTAAAKPTCAAALCALLAQRRDGWRAEDVQAQLLLRSGKTDAAVAVWEAMLRGRRGPADQTALSRAEALAMGDPQAGIAACRAWLAAYPNSPLRERVEVQSALLHLQCGNSPGAIKGLEAFLAARPGSPYAAEAAEALAKAKRASEAMVKSEAVRAVQAQARAKDPVAADLERAENLLARGRFGEAAQGFEAFKDRRNHPQWGRAWYGLGLVRRASGDTDGALAAWDDLWRRALADSEIPCAAEARRAAGDAWLEDLADPARALRYYDDAVARDPAVAAKGALDLNRGLALLMIGRDTEAKTLFTRRRDAAGADKVEFLRWDNLVILCAGGRLKPPPRGLLSAERRALADLMLADGLFAAGEHSRALRLYRRAAPPLAGREGADQCDLGAARALTQLGLAKDALALYARFEREHRQSPLASGALLRAGTLCAAPPMSDFGKARDWFAKVVANHPGTPEAEAAEFYTATLAWRARKWTEAATLHKAFASNHPNSPLARVALDERLPAIAKKSLDVPLHDPVDRTVTVYVRPYDRKRKAIPIVKTSAYNAHLDIRPVNAAYVLVDSDITLQNSRRNISSLWTGPDPKSASLHRYHLAKTFSGEEYVQVDGTITRPTSGGPGRPPPFRVTVPSVDVDWEGFADWSHEDGEDTRRVIVPYTNSIPAIRWLRVQIPYDDYGLVHPILTLHCVDANALCLLNEAGTSFPNGGQIDARAVPSWPLRFRAEPLAPTTECIVRVLGEADPSSEQATDTIRARVVNVDLDIDANHDNAITDADEPLEENPGGIACVCTNNLTPINLKLEPAGLPGKLTLSATGGGIQVWQGATPLTLPKTWPANAFPATLSVEGTNASATARDVELRLEYNENPVGLDNPLFKCEDVIRLTVVKVDLTNMTFGMGWNIVPDTGGNYPTPHWTATNSSPYLYEESTRINATATFKVDPSTYTGNITLSGDGPGDLDFTNTTVSVSGGLATYPATFSAGTLTNYVNFWNPMQINWKYGIGGTATAAAGQTSNKVYVCLANPAGLTLYHTVVHLACSSGHATNEPQAFTNSWARFTAAGAGPANVATWDGKNLYYYRDGFGWANSALNTAQLLQSANSPNAWAGHGQCGSFAHLLIDTLAINGVSSDWVTAEAVNGNAFLVKDWTFSATPSYPAEPNYKWKITLITEPDASTGMVLAPAGRIYADLTKLTTLNGQNSAPPSEEFFGCHFIVRYNGLYYDPSYGVTYTDANDFENKAVEGYAVPDAGLDYKVRHATGLGNMSLNP